MKVFHDLYSQTISLENLFQAWEEFKKGKRKKNGVGEFELNLEDNLFELHGLLQNRSYRHGKYTGFFITDPKLRHIHKAEVRDRVVHHAIFTTLNPIFDSTFISDSFSCRKGYGTHKGFKRLVKYARKVSKNYKVNCWALKSDIRKFFDTVDHKILLKIIERKIKDEDTIWLIEEIIRSYCSCYSEFSLGSEMLKQVQHDKNVDEHKGIPIGNLTSQLFSNVYLNELDQFVKHQLKIKHYLRYADDFIILNSSKELLKRQLEAIEEFLEEKLKLSLHKGKTKIRKLSWGIDFVGYVALPNYQVLRTKTKIRIFRKIDNIAFQYKTGKITKYAFEQSVASYMGILRFAYSNKIRRRILEKIRKQTFY